MDERESMQYLLRTKSSNLLTQPDARVRAWGKSCSVDIDIFSVVGDDLTR